MKPYQEWLDAQGSKGMPTEEEEEEDDEED
jgi:hypothetical protein